MSITSVPISVHLIHVVVHSSSPILPPSLDLQPHNIHIFTQNILHHIGTYKTEVTLSQAEGTQFTVGGRGQGAGGRGG